MDSSVRKLLNSIRDLRLASDDYNSQDVDFVREMIVHHEMAVEMAGEQTRDGKNDEIIKLAEAIIVAQKKEIEQMRQWLKDRGLKEDDDEGM